MFIKPAKPMDAETAQEKLQQIFDDGHLNLAIAGCAAEMCYQTGDDARDSYFALIAAGILVDKHFGETQVETWITERAKAQGNKVATAEEVAQGRAQAEQAAELQAA